MNWTDFIFPVVALATVVGTGIYHFMERFIKHLNKEEIK